MKQRYTKETIKTLINTNRDTLITGHITKKNWDMFRLSNKNLELPTADTLALIYGGWNNFIKEFDLGKVNRQNYSKNQLFNVAICHYNFFILSGMDKWSEYARMNDLPSVKSFIGQFSTWLKAKGAVKSEYQNRHSFV